VAHLYYAEAPAAHVTPPDNMRIVSYLPLSHVAAQMLDMVAPLVITACGGGYGPPSMERHYYTTWFAKPDALKVYIYIYIYIYVYI